jgi:hypothetical protein
LFECGFDAAAAETTVEEGSYLHSGQAAGGGAVDGFEDTVGGVVAGGCPGAAFYKRWSGVSTQLLRNAFSFLSARLHAPGD